MGAPTDPSTSGLAFSREAFLTGPPLSVWSVLSSISTVLGTPLVSKKTSLQLRRLQHQLASLLAKLPVAFHYAQRLTLG